MMIRSVTILALLMLALVVSPGARADDQTLLIIGDSLSDAYDMPRESGWAALLSERLGDDWQVVNASISGETTSGAAYRIDGLLRDHQPDALLIILGGNDGLRALAPSQIKSNLEAVIDKGKRAGTRVALMRIRLPANLGPVYSRRFDAVYEELASKYELPLLPFFLSDIFDQPGMMMDDGIHPTEQAQPLMLEAIWPELSQLLGVISQ